MQFPDLLKRQIRSRGMIRALFLPDEWFSQDIIGVEIGKYTVSACKAVKKGQITTIQKITTINIETNNEKTHEEQTVIALDQLLSPFTNGHLRICLANNQVFFKELTVPFLDDHKIKMILGYEIEASLPFPLAEATFDFIILKQDKIKKESTILVAIAKKNQISFITDLIKQTKTKLKISAITIDLLGTLNLYNNIYSKKLDHCGLLLDLGKNCITISYLWHGKPLLVRNLPYGLYALITKAMQVTHKSYQEVIEYLFRFGLDQTQDTDLKIVFEKLINDLNFTINSFRQQLSPDHKIERMLICESAIEIKHIANYLTNQINLECQILELNKLGIYKNLVIKTNLIINPNNLPCLLAILNNPDSPNFNLLPSEEITDSLLGYQIFTAGIITILILGTVYGVCFIKNQTLNQTLLRYQKEAISELKAAFGEIEARNLTSAINEAEARVNREKKIWFSFSNQNGNSVLKYLQIISNALDVDKLNLDLKKLIIKDDLITLQGSVAHDEDIAPLEHALTPIFKITSPQSTNFDIKMTLKQKDGGEIQS